MAQFKVSFAGAGRVAGALCTGFFNAGVHICQVVSESEKNGLPLARECNASWSSELIFTLPADIIIVAVPDHRLAEVLNKIRCNPGTIVAHTAGSLGLDIFPSAIERKGVFYPLQTFSKGRNIIFSELPFLLEASDTSTLSFLNGLAGLISNKICFADTEHRKMLHLAAVFTCNFTNYMLTAGKTIAEKGGFSFDILEPLINETIRKAMENNPENSQTGPAVRNDLNTIEKHLELLSFSPELKRLYGEVTRSIIDYYNIRLND